MATKAAQRARIHRLVNIQFGGDGILEEDRHGNVAGVSDTESDSDDDLNFYDSSDDDNEDDAQRAKDSNQESRNPIIAVHDGRDDDDMFVDQNKVETPDYSSFGDGYESEFEDEKEDGDLSDRELRETQRRIDNAELEDQGFCPSASIATGGEAENRVENPYRDEKSIEFNGKTFDVGKCYNYRHPEDEWARPIWIFAFASDRTAYYCEVLPKSGTFLGKPHDPKMVNEELNGVDTDTEDTKLVNEELFEMEQAKDLPFDYVKVIPKKALFLGYITEEHPNPTPAALPDWIYLRRRKGTSLRFGYIYQPLDNPPRRQGLRKGPIRVLDLFAGAGGMHQGFKRVPGFQTAKVVEMNELSVKTFRSNNPGVSVYAGDVRKFLQEARDPQIRKKLGVIDHIHASPPCQGFSCANIWGGKNDEANNNLSLVWIDAIRQFRPKTASFENVGGMWRNKHFHYLRFIMKELLALGYQFRVNLLYACDYGDPQIRPRLVIVASQKHIMLPQLPKPTHGNLESGLMPFVMVSDVLEGMVSDKNDPFDGIRITQLTKEDKNVVTLQANKLAPTMRAGGPPVMHYEQDRCVTVREFAALQSFPRGYNFYGKTSEKYRQIGNAVPVEMATAIAREIMTVLKFRYEGEE